MLTATAAVSELDQYSLITHSFLSARNSRTGPRFTLKLLILYILTKFLTRTHIRNSCHPCHSDFTYINCYFPISRWGFEFGLSQFIYFSSTHLSNICLLSKFPELILLLPNTENQPPSIWRYTHARNFNSLKPTKVSHVSIWTLVIAFGTHNPIVLC